MVVVGCNMYQNPRLFFTYGFVMALAAITVSYIWLDIPLAQWAHAHHLRDYTWLRTVQRLPNLFPAIAFVSIIGLTLRSYRSKLGYHAQALLSTSLAFVVCYFLTKILKIIFARTWPATWVDNNPSLLSDGVYGFFWFRDDRAYQSFPSGHTSAIFVVSLMLIYYYPRARWLAAIACAMVITGLIGNYYHFLSDIIAGAYLGMASGLFMIQYRKQSTIA